MQMETIKKLKGFYLYQTIVRNKKKKMIRIWSRTTKCLLEEYKGNDEADNI